MRSAWRGVARKAPAPKRSRSNRGPLTAIISMAQQARPKVMGHREFLRPQFMAKSRLVTIRPSSKRFSIQDIRFAPFLGQLLQPAEAKATGYRAKHAGGICV